MDLRATGTIDVEVVYALPHRQFVVALQVRKGTTAREAVSLSGIESHFDGLDLSRCRLGVFARVVDDAHVVEHGDRIEIYRPLVADPKEVRRQLAAEGKTMGRKRDQDSASTTRATTSPSK